MPITQKRRMSLVLCYFMFTALALSQVAVGTKPVYQRNYLFQMDLKYKEALNSHTLSTELKNQFKENKFELLPNASITVEEASSLWWIVGEQDGIEIKYLIAREGEVLKVAQLTDQVLQSVVISENAVTEDQKRLQLWKRYYVYQERPRYAQKPEQYFLGEPDPNSFEFAMGSPVGWVSLEYLQSSYRALQTRDKIYKKLVVFDNKYSSTLFKPGDFTDGWVLLERLTLDQTPIASYLRTKIKPETLNLLNQARTNRPKDSQDLEVSLEEKLMQDLNAVLEKDNLYDANRFAGIQLRQETQKLLDSNPKEQELARLHRMLLEDAFPDGIAKGYQRVPLYAAPGKMATELRKTPVLSFFYVYREYARDQDEFCLIGLYPSINLDKAGEELLGWISTASCQRWDTLLAVEYEQSNLEQRSQHGMVELYAGSDYLKNPRGKYLFNLADDAEEILNQNKVPEDIASRFREHRLPARLGKMTVQIKTQGREWAIKSQQGEYRIIKEENTFKLYEIGVIARETAQIRWNHNDLRYPLLRTEPIGGKRAFQLGFLGGEGNEEAKMMINHLRRIMAEMGKVDIVFVIDATDSIEKYRSKVKDAVKNTIETLRRVNENEKFKLDIALGIVFYRDFPPDYRKAFKRGIPDEPFIVHLIPLSQDIGEFEQALAKEKFVSGFDLRESMFYGIDCAFHRKMGWREGSTRYMIVMGDAANHEAGSASPHDKSKLKIEDIKPILEKNQIHLYGIQFLKNTAMGQVSIFKDFGEQIRALSTEPTEKCLTIYEEAPVTQGDSQNPWSPESAIEALLNYYIAKIKLAHRILDMLVAGITPDDIYRDPSLQKLSEEIFKGKLKSSSQGTPITKLIEGAIPPGIDPQKVAAAMEKTFFVEAWVWELHPQFNLQQIHICLFMDKDSLGRMTGFLSAIKDRLIVASTQKAYVDTWLTLLNEWFGITRIPEGQSIADAIQQHGGLPFVNGILNYTLPDFIAKCREPRFRQELLLKMEEKYRELSDIQYERETLKKVSDGIETTVPRKRWFKEYGKRDFAWIEIERFP